MLKLKTGYLFLCKSLASYLTLSLFLWLLLLITFTLTLTSRLFYTIHQTNNSLKLSSLPWCLTKIEFALDTSTAKKVMKNFWFVDFLDPFGNFHFTLSEYIVSRHPFLTINMNSSVVWSGSNSKWIALVKKSCFFSLFLPQYIIVPAESVPITWKGLVPVILSNKRMLCCYVVNGLVGNLFHLKHFLNTFFTIFPEGSHCWYYVPMHCSLLSFIGGFLSK